MLRNVKNSFFKAQEAFANFIKVTQFRVKSDNNVNQDLVCFAKSKDEYFDAI